RRVCRGNAAGPPSGTSRSRESAGVVSHVYAGGAGRSHGKLSVARCAGRRFVRRDLAPRRREAPSALFDGSAERWLDRLPELHHRLVTGVRVGGERADELAIERLEQRRRGRELRRERRTNTHERRPWTVQDPRDDEQRVLALVERK